MPGNRWHERVRAGGQDHVIEGDGRAVVELCASPSRIEDGHLATEAIVDATVDQCRIGDQTQVGLGPTLEPRRESDPVVRRSRLFADHRDPDGTIGVCLDESFDESLTHHSVTNDEHLLNDHVAIRPRADFGEIRGV